jgi:hypothetical protein
MGGHCKEVWHHLDEMYSQWYFEKQVINLCRDKGLF